MLTQCLPGILIPFAGTTLGSACVFFMKKTLHEGVQRALTGFAAGVMVAASIWSLLIPAMEQSKGLGRLAFIPATVGFWLGIGFLLLLDMAVPHLHQGADTPEGPHSGFSRTTMLVLAVTLHNIPEGMAVGVVLAGSLSKTHAITTASAFALAVGIAIQNFPEGAIISMPLVGAGLSRKKAFLYGFGSGVVEPVGALLTILLTSLVTPILPYILSFAAGAMIYVVVEELIPEGMAVGVVYAGYLTGSASITAMGALALSLGIAIQNFPEGAIISMPLKAAGMSRGRAFWAGTLSGAVEPVGALFTIWAAGLVVPALPYLLSFAAGAMIYVVVEELIPEMSQGEHSNVGTICFALGFSVMMVLDVALG